MSLTQAKDVLARSGLKARIYSDPAMYLVRPPDVTGQRPEAGTLVSRGSVVELKCYGVGDNYPVWPY
jgi:beta-lactam-binding protein with PASTA domain